MFPARLQSIEPQLQLARSKARVRESLKSPPKGDVRKLFRPLPISTLRHKFMARDSTNRRELVDPGGIKQLSPRAGPH